MKKLISTIILCSVAFVVNAQKVTSPNGNLSANTNGKNLVINYKKQQVLELTDIEFTKLDFVRKVKDDYQMLETRTTWPFDGTFMVKAYSLPFLPMVKRMSCGVNWKSA